MTPGSSNYQWASTLLLEFSAALLNNYLVNPSTTIFENRLFVLVNFMPNAKNQKKIKVTTTMPRAGYGSFG